MVEDDSDMSKTIFDNKVSVPLISVAMPVYNGERFLVEAIDSILAQTFVNFELIVISDASTDGSLKLLQEYKKKDSRIRLISHEKNKNVAGTLNEIISLSRGKWIARMDQDDIALPQRFERQLAWLESTGADIVGSWVKRFGTSDKRIVKLRKTDEAIKAEMLFRSPLAHPSVMVSAVKIKELLYDEIRWEAEDYDLWERAIEAGWKMSNVPEVLLHYRVHPGQISAQKASRQQQLGQEIRRRYWKFVSEVWCLDRALVEEVLKFFEPTPEEIDMDSVDELFAMLFAHTDGEAKDVVLYNLKSLYFRVAADCPNVVSRWGKMNQKFGTGRDDITKLLLLLLRLLRLNPDSLLFRQLRKLYVWRASR
jgi:glycosyltransferase involved in cell wall biosynthesis